jgi:hypothetical protein
VIAWLVQMGFVLGFVLIDFVVQDVPLISCLLILSLLLLLS